LKYPPFIHRLAASSASLVTWRRPSRDLILPKLRPGRSWRRQCLPLVERSRSPPCRAITSHDPPPQAPADWTAGQPTQTTREEFPPSSQLPGPPAPPRVAAVAGWRRQPGGRRADWEAKAFDATPRSQIWLRQTTLLVHERPRDVPPGGRGGRKPG
jgi:hypothetical protein